MDIKKSNLASGIRLLRALKDPRVPAWIKFLPLLALVYVVSPIDFIPDPLIILGWLDDILVVVGLLSQTAKALNRYDTKALPPISR